MKAAELQKEIEESLLRGMRVFAENTGIEVRTSKGGSFAFRVDELEAFCRERAANLAQGLASRTLSEETAGLVVNWTPGCLDSQNFEIAQSAFRDLEGK